MDPQYIKPALFMGIKDQKYFGWYPCHFNLLIAVILDQLAIVSDLCSWDGEQQLPFLQYGSIRELMAYEIFEFSGSYIESFPQPCHIIPGFVFKTQFKPSLSPDRLP